MNTEDKESAMELACEQFLSCSACPDMVKHRNNVVFGCGPVTADIMVIGNSPNYMEDKTGYTTINRELHDKPVDDAAEILIQSLEDNEVHRSRVYYTNQVLCRPVEQTVSTSGTSYKDRSATAQEKSNCLERLHFEIYTIDPKIIIILGDEASKLVTRTKLSDAVGRHFDLTIPGRIEGNTLHYPAIVTYHPNFVRSKGRHRRPGSPADLFHRHISLACKIARVGKELSKGVDDE